MPFNTLSKAFVLCFLTLHVSFASTPKDISFFKDKPTSTAKDFYIYEYLNSQNCTTQDAWKLLPQASKMSLKLFHAFAKKLGYEGIKKDSKCMTLEIKELLASDDKDCIATGLSIFEAAKLDKKTLLTLAEKLSSYPEALPLKVLAQENIYEAMMSGKDEFFETFNKIGAAYRREHFDKEIPAKKIEELSHDERFNGTIKHIVTDLKLKEVQKSLLHVNAQNPKLAHQSLFYLGLNALKLESKEKAIAYFDMAYKKAYFPIDKDKVLFWQYLATQDESYKKLLLESNDVNIYTILAGKKNDRVMIVKAYEKHPFFDEKDPFAWVKLRESIKGKTSEELEALAKIYLYGSTLPHYALLMEKASKYKDHYFPVAYPQFLPKASVHRKALILALARQESHLLPATVSVSYALGMMQFMPFLAKDIAKKKGFIDFKLEDMFNPETAYLFGDIHLDYLEKYLHSPLFVAYAYNGGIGFTKRLLLGGFFSKGEYEPYMSMELIHYDESREYGKKVLANYIIYREALEESVDVTKLFEELLDTQSDKFRMKP